MAEIGQLLLTPATGYKRIEENHQYITYPIGTWLSQPSVEYSGGTRIYNSSQTADKIAFKFKGTDLIFLGHYYLEYFDTASLFIDGIEHTIIKQCLASQAQSASVQAIITGLTDKVHLVEITTTNGSYIVFDAIDINETGEMVPIITYKHFIKSNNQIFTLSDNQLVDTVLINPTETDFLSQGFYNLNTLNSSLLSTLSSSEIEILTYTDIPTDIKVWLELSTQPFKPIDILNKAESFEVLTWTDDATYPEKTLELTVPEYRLIDQLDAPISIVTYTDAETAPSLLQQYDYPNIGARILKRG